MSLRYRRLRAQKRIKLEEKVEGEIRTILENNPHLQNLNISWKYVTPNPIIAKEYGIFDLTLSKDRQKMILQLSKEMCIFLIFFWILSIAAIFFSGREVYEIWWGWKEYAIACSKTLVMLLILWSMFLLYIKPIPFVSFEFNKQTKKYREFFPSLFSKIQALFPLQCEEIPFSRITWVQLTYMKFLFERTKEETIMYQLNLILDDFSQKYLLEYRYEKQAQQQAKELAMFLSVPLYDITPYIPK